MEESKGIHFSSFFIYIAIFFLGVATVSNFVNFFQNGGTYELIRAIGDSIIVVGYFGLIQKKKAGLMAVFGGIIYLFISQLLLDAEKAGIIIFSPEFLLTVVVLCSLISKFKELK